MIGHDLSNYRQLQHDNVVSDEEKIVGIKIQ